MNKFTTSFLSFLFLLFFTSLYSQNKVVVLDKGVRIEEQIKASNTLYKISDTYNLNGKELRIPKGCVLYFDGGSIINGSIYFDETDLQGFPQIINCKLNGTIPKADITWFGARRSDTSVDVGAIINNVQSIATHIVIPAGDFYQTKEAIRIEGEKYIEWIGTIVSNCNKTPFDAFTISSGVMNLEMKGSLVCKSSSIKYTIGNQTNLNGLVCENIYNSSISIGTVKGFNNGLKVFGYGAGCSYNTFHIQAIRECNTGILITQRDKDGQRGWANENTFIGGRFGVSSSWDIKKRETHAVVAKGIYSDDSYNKVNSLYFLRPCAEGTYVPFVFNNAEVISVVDCRSERGDVGAKLSGKTNRILMSNSVGSSMSNLDLSELVYCQPRPLFLKLSDKDSFTTISFDKNDSRSVVSEGKGFTFSGNFKHISYKGSIQKTPVPTSDGDVSELGTEIVFEKNQGIRNRVINIEIPQNNSGSRRYVYVIIEETYNGKAANEKDLAFAQSLSYSKLLGEW